jgi:predicted esterase
MRTHPVRDLAAGPARATSATHPPASRKLGFKRPLTLLLGVLVLTLWPAPAGAVIVLFKDGFTIQGRITHPAGHEVDPITQGVITLPDANGLYRIDDDVRHIYFTPQHVANIMRDPVKTNPIESLRLTAWTHDRPSMPANWRYVGDVTPDSDWSRWERKVVLKYALPKGEFKDVSVEQRITILSPQRMRVHAKSRIWSPRYLTRELEGERLQSLLHDYYTVFKIKKVKEREMHLNTARFLIEAGWPGLARKELEEIGADVNQKGEAGELLKDVCAREATEAADDVDRAFKAGQYRLAVERLQRFQGEKISKWATRDQRARIKKLKEEMDGSQRSLAEARTALKELTAEVPQPQQPTYRTAAEVIAAELNPDNVQRLEPFLEYVGSYRLAKKNKAKPRETAEEVLAVGLSGWILGKEASDTDKAGALSLWQLRELVLEYQRTKGRADRDKVLARIKANVRAGTDVVARVIRSLPPPQPFAAKLNDEPLEMKAPSLIKGGRDAKYLLQAPREYNPNRSYPVLIALHKGADKAELVLEKWSQLAAENGFFLAAPFWSPDGKGTYYYSEEQHDIVLATLRDLRRRFQIDSDRVFLFGAGEAGRMAYDVGLSHPDQFAGLMVMTAAPHSYAKYYTPNAQNLPLYIVDGGSNGGSPGLNMKEVKKWVGARYNVLYFEYLGRGQEWFGAELPSMMTWMRLQKRAFPKFEVGRGNRDDSMQTLRPSDNRFYWLGTDDPKRNKAASSLYARINGNMIIVRTWGLKQVTIRLAPGMVSFSQPVQLNVNGQALAPRKVQPNLETLLEDYYERGDRQHLYVAMLQQ